MDVDIDGRGRTQPESDRVWSIETHGIDPIPDSDRHGKPQELFWIWCAANIGILGVTYGAFLVVFYSLNLWQGILAALIGTILSFFLVGFVSLAGKRGGAPTLVLSRAAFGIRGNALPTVVSYVSLVGWEIILVALSTLAAETVLERLGWLSGDLALVVSFIVIAGATIVIGLLGHATIVKIQTWFTWGFAILTVVFIGLAWSSIDFDAVSGLPTGPFWSGFVAGTSIIMAGLGIGWVNAGADYSRYLPKGASSRAVVGWTVFGASVAPIILIVFGVLLAADNADVATSGANPIGVLAEPLPTWFLVPYMVVAVGGLIGGALLDIYSSGLNLLTLGLRVPRYQSVVIDGVLMLIGNTYILFFNDNFFLPFQGFLITLGVLLAAWSAIFLVDMGLYRRRGYAEGDLYAVTGRYGAWNVAGVASFLVAGFVGLGLVSSAPTGEPAWIFSWVGYLLRWFGWEDTAFATSSVGLLLAFAIAGALYAVLSRRAVDRAGATVGS
jgi:purine-cytosine permease-like protein